MRLSMETYAVRNLYNDEEAVKLLKKAGFDAYDYSLYHMEDDVLGEDYRKRAMSLRKIADEAGIACNQAHAPWDFKYGVDEISTLNYNYDRLIRSIEVASILGADNIIIHAVKMPDETLFEEFNLKFYKSFIPYCEKFNICVSVENLFGMVTVGDKTEFTPVFSDPQKHISFIKKINSKYINACVDVGHSAITGYLPEEVLAQFGNDTLKALHIHDNHFTNDDHALPGEGIMDWDKITKALSGINYNADLTLEIIGFMDGFNEDTILDGLKTAEKTGRDLINKILS